jgi:hypothetical protein
MTLVLHSPVYHSFGRMGPQGPVPSAPIPSSMEQVRTQKVLDLRGTNRVNPCGSSWVEHWDLGSDVPGRVAAKTPNEWSRTVDHQGGWDIPTYRLWSVIRTQKVLDLRGRNRINPCGRSWVERWDLGSDVPDRVVVKTASNWLGTVDPLKGHHSHPEGSWPS